MTILSDGADGPRSLGEAASTGTVFHILDYPNDHPPAHVHVIGPGWVAVVNLLGPEVREAIGCNEAQARRVLRLVAEHQTALLAAWRKWHG